MSKVAQTEFAVTDLIKNRWSPRAFSAEPLSETAVKTLIEGASWAASSNNEQPWRYYYALRGTAGFDSICECLVASNQAWAKHAAVLMICVGKKLGKSGAPNTYYEHDCGMANASLLLQAVSMGFYGHIMGGFSKEKAATLFHLNSETDTPVCAIALGYLGSPEQLDESLKAREQSPRTRKPLNEIATEV